MQPIRWPLEAIWQAVEPSLPGFTCEAVPSIASTNTELMRRFRAGALEPTLLVAEQQTAGRGRLGRQWHSVRAGSLMFSLGMQLAPVDWSGLSLAVGVSLAESLDPPNHPDARIALKWPNDLWLTHRKNRVTQERKLAGVLVETASWEGVRYVVMGVGINCRPVPWAPTEGPALAPGCLQDLAGESGADGAATDVASTLLRVVPALVNTVQVFEQFGFSPFQARFARRDALAGRVVQLSGGTEGASISGEACGVTETGALLVHTPAGMKEITSSEVSVRPC